MRARRAEEGRRITEREKGREAAGERNERARKGWGGKGEVGTRETRRKEPGRIKGLGGRGCG